MALWFKRFALVGLLVLPRVDAAAESAADKVPKLPAAKLEVVPRQPGRALELSPFFVSGDKHPWLYGTLPGFEILTRAPEDRIHHLLICYLRSRLIENEVIPQEWLRESPIPYTIIIDDANPKAAGAASALPALIQAQDYDLFGWKLRGLTFERSLPDKVTPLRGWLHAADDDTTVLGANLYGDPFMVHAPTWVDRIDRSAPALPAWVMAGLLGSQGLWENRTDMVVGVTHSLSDPGAQSFVIFRGIRWISTSESKRLAAEFSHHRGAVQIPFMPLQEFFSESPPAPERRALWESEAGLLVRWGLLGINAAVSLERRAQFVRFVDRQRREPATEKMAIECFGRDYAALEQELKEYLEKTLGREIQLTMEMLKGFRDVELIPASPDQIGRITGDWMRLQGESLRKSDPAKAKIFFDAADRTLARAWLRNPDQQIPVAGNAIAAGKGNLAALLNSSELSPDKLPNPDLMAVCGLYEYDVGDTKLARDVLELAAAAHTTRPKAYVVLAELRLREVLAKPAGKDGALSTAQATYVLQVLKTALTSSTSAEPWRLMVDALVRCESTPSAANLDAVIKGAAQFPRDAELQLGVARLCLRAGEKDRAGEVIGKTLPLIVDEKAKSEFQKLRDSTR